MSSFTYLLSFSFLFLQTLFCRLYWRALSKKVAWLKPWQMRSGIAATLSQNYKWTRGYWWWFMSSSSASSLSSALLLITKTMTIMILQDMLGWGEGIAATLSWNPKQPMGGGGRGIKSRLLEKRPFIFLCFKHTNCHISIWGKKLLRQKLFHHFYKFKSLPPSLKPCLEKHKGEQISV